MNRWPLITLLTVMPMLAHATDPGTCYTISDADARTLCLAKAHNDPSRCYAIQDSSKRAECLAEVRK